MNARIVLDNDRRAFAPGEHISGKVSWTTDEVPAHALVRLCWFTRGKGTSDMEVISTCPIDEPLPSDQRPFAFEAPSEPHSCSGNLISLVWSIELILQPGHHCRHLEIIISPDAEEIILPTASQRETPLPPESRSLPRPESGPSESDGRPISPLGQP